MKQILIVGMDPYTIDFSSPGFAPGLTAEKVEMGIKAERENLKNLGYDSDLYWIDSGAQELTKLVDLLKTKQFDGILIGAGIRIPPINFTLFEKLVNTAHGNAPAAKIIFNTNPLDTAESIKRWL